MGTLAMILLIEEIKPDEYHDWAQMVLDYDPDMADQLADTWAKIHSPWNDIRGARFIKDGREIIGFIQFKRHEFFFGKAPICYLSDLYIKPEHRRLGYARRTLNWMIDHARRNLYGRLYWITHKDNVEAQGLYDSVAAGEFIRYHIDFIRGM
jgi:ribosomal protein S18 acetylase RimI-like enzyme